MLVSCRRSRVPRSCRSVFFSSLDLAGIRLERNLDGACEFPLEQCAVQDHPGAGRRRITVRAPYVSAIFEVEGAVNGERINVFINKFLIVFAVYIMNRRLPSSVLRESLDTRASPSFWPWAWIRMAAGRLPAGQRFFPFRFARRAFFAFYCTGLRAKLARSIGKYLIARYQAFRAKALQPNPSL